MNRTSPGQSSPPARAYAAISLSGRYAGPGRQAATGLRVWARSRGVELRVDDDRSDPARTERLYRANAPTADLLFGPYGSGPSRAAARALARSREVMWNHGGAAIDTGGARVVSVIAPADRYWTGLAPVLAGAGIPLERVALLHAPTGFGRATAAGARRSLAASGASPLIERAFDERSASDAALAALRSGAQAVIGCGRIEDDLALGRALSGFDGAVGLVVCGIGLAHERLGTTLEGWFGPAVWWPGGPTPPIPLPAGMDYPAAQALAGGLVAERVLAKSTSTDPDALWEAALTMRTQTFIGPFAVDRSGGQVALAPFLVRWTPGDGALVREPIWSAGEGLNIDAHRSM